MTTPARYDVIVMGAGLAGLVAAATARRQGGSVVVLDVTAPGGRARSDVVDDIVWNRGPRAVFRAGAAARLLNELGVPLHGGRPAGRAGLVVGGSVVPLRALRPGGPLMSWQGAGRLQRAMRALWRGEGADPTRRFGDWLDDADLDGVPRLVVEAAVRLATYSPNPAELSSDAAVAHTATALRGVVYLHGGWQTLVDALVGTTPAGAPPVVRVPAGATLEATPGGWRAGGFQAPTAVVACGGPAAAAAACPSLADLPGFTRSVTPSELGGPRIVRSPHSADAPRSAGAVVASCLDLAVRRRPQPGFVLGLDEPTYVSAHTPAARLAPAGIDVVHVLVAGGASQETVEQVASRVVGAADVVRSRHLRSMTVMWDAPTADRGGLPGRPRVDVPDRPGLFIAGDWVGPEGLLADAAVSSGHAAGRAAAAAAAVTAAAATTLTAHRAQVSG